MLAACSDELGGNRAQSDNPIQFGARFEKASSVLTRADDTDSETFDSVYIASKPFDMDFYIQLNCTEPGGNVFSEFGTYVIPSGYEGQLVAKPGTTPLDWHDLVSPHTFYSWNMTWDDPDVTQPSTEDVKVKFYNSSEEDGFDDYHNNDYLENFVGAKSDPFSYSTHGKYVDLTFFHLVSKIKIGSLILIQTDGSIQEDLKADITFVNMPTEATFHPHPADASQSRNGMPYVGEPYKRSVDDGVTYFVDNDPLTEDWFYICPEIDFSQVDFKVKLNSILYEGYNTYYGTFDDVIFERVPGSRYDNVDGTDSKILHAGEMMTLEIVLIPGVGPGLKIIISDWSTDKPTESQYHTEPGIYSDSEVSDLLNEFIGMTKWPSTDEEWEALYEKFQRLVELYGETIDGTNYFYIYDNVAATTDGKNLSNIFPIPPGYVLDGLGHIIQMRANRGVFPGNPPYYNIGPCRDVYLTDENGNNSIYIDSDGYVWISDPVTGAYTKTDNYLPPLGGRNSSGEIEKSYDINALTGEVRKSSYFNNTINR